MKIALIATNPWGWGGSELLWSQTAARLVQKGVPIGINMICRPEIPPPVLELKSHCVLELRNPDDKAQPRDDFKWLDRHRPELAVISQGMAYDGLNWMTACSDRNIPYAVIIQAAAEHAWPEGVEARFLSDSFRKARRCYFVSVGNRLLVEKQLGVRLDNACVVRNPFNVPFSSDLVWPEGPSLKVACVARLDCRPKGQDILLEVLRDPKWKGRLLTVNLYGEGLMRPTLERLVDLWGLTCVKFHGFVPNVQAIWQTNHALILPSRFEGLPLAIVEAMLCGRPCVVTDVGGNAELIRDNVDGFVAKVPKAEFLDEAMERAWQRRSEWQGMGRLASISIKKYIPSDPVEAFTLEILNLFEELKKDG